MCGIDVYVYVCGCEHRCDVQDAVFMSGVDRAISMDGRLEGKKAPCRCGRSFK